MRKFLSRREAIKFIGTGASTICLLPLINTSCSHEKRPNIIFMTVDNLGRESVGYYGQHIYKTPRMDKLASEGVVFENCLIATPLCGPARCAWNTGRHPYRVGLNSQPKPNDPNSGLSTKEETIAKVLKKSGYRTALFGKWNLGYDKKFNPLNHGFDVYYGSTAGHADYYTHFYNSSNRKHFYRDKTPVDDKGYFDQLFTDEAIKYIKKHKNSRAPFYLNLCFYAPHGPYQAPPGYYHSNDPLKNYQYMIEYLDYCVGRVVDTVDQLGMSENTLLVFLSDQGASTANDYDRDLAEGGLKVICNARWKGHIPAGKRVRTPWMHLDLFHTFAFTAKAEVPTDRGYDGQNIWPLFEGRELDYNRTLCWTYRDEDAIRVGDWKLRWKTDKMIGLFDLSNDPEEKNDLSAKYPDKVKNMQMVHAKWKTECEKSQTSTNNSGESYHIKDHNNSY